MALKKYDQEIVDKIVLNVDTELGDSWNYGSDDLSYLRREYIDRFFRLDIGNEQDDYSKYHSPLIQNHVLQTRAYLMRPFNKSKTPLIKFPNALSTEYINYLFRYELGGKKLLMDSAFNGALLKTMAVKVGVNPTMIVEEDYAIFEGPDREVVEEAIDEFFAEDEGLTQVGDTEWEEVKAEVEVFEAPELAPEVPVGPQAAADPAAAQDALESLPGFPNEAEEVTEEAEPVLEDNIEMYKATVRYKKEMVENRPFVDVVPPYELHISRQAPSQEDAGIVGRVTPMTLTELKVAYPDAPKLNGYKNKKQAEKFWEEVNGEWLGWTQQNEWYEMWLKDNSSYYEGYYFNVTINQDSPAHAYLVADVDIKMDPYNTGYARLYNVVKVGHFVLSCEEIAQPSFKVGSLIPVGGRWLGLSVADLIWDEDNSMTLQVRAVEDAILQSTYSNPIVDQEQVHLEDVINRAPESVIRRRLNAVPKQGVPAIDWTKHPDPSGSSFTIMDKFQEFAGTATGAGKFFQGHNADNISSSRVTEETAQVIENNSDLMLDELSMCFWEFWEEVLLMLHNACVMGKAAPLSFEVDGEEKTVDPIEDLPLVKTGQISLTVGSNEEKKQLDMATSMLDALVKLEAAPSIANLITPQGKAAIVAEYFVRLGADEKLVEQAINPQSSQDVLQSPEVQQAIQQATQAAQEQAQQEIEAYKNSAEERRKDMELQHKMQMERDALDLKMHTAAAKIASDEELRGQSQEKLDNVRDRDVANIGIAEEKLELDEKNSDREYTLARTQDIRTELG